MDFIKYQFIDGQSRSNLTIFKNFQQIAKIFLCALIFFIFFCPELIFAGKIPEGTTQKIKCLNIPFVMNEGQMDLRVRFFAKTFSGTVYVTKQGQIVYQLPPRLDKKNRGWVLTEEALGGLPVKQVQGEEKSKAKVSFFICNDSDQWKGGLATYEMVNLGEIYKGIGLKLRAYGAKVEKIYYVSPGREPKEIQIRVKGADSLKVNEKGELEVHTGNGAVIFSRPRAFQQEGGNQREVEVAYLVNGNQYGFKVGNYDNSRELIIDPLIQSTYLGGNSTDLLNSMVVSEGNVYVTGKTLSLDFPGITGGAQELFGGNQDIFVAKLSTDLKQIVQATYLGGENIDEAKSIAVSSGNIYVAGFTLSDNFPGTAGSAQPAYGGGFGDGFVSLLNADLTNLIQSTYLGGNGSDAVYSMAGSGANVYVAGYTSSSNFPGTFGGAQSGFGGGADDGFVSCLSDDLKTLKQSTYLGGNGIDTVNSISVSEGGLVFVAGHTASTNFPQVDQGYQTTYGGGVWDAFVSKLDPDLKKIGQSTYLGGTGNDQVHSIAVSGQNVYVTGSTNSYIFPGTSGGAQPGYGGGDYDAFVSLLNLNLSQLVQSTYLGGTDNDGARSISISEGNVYVSGLTKSAAFPGITGGAQEQSGGDMDAFASLLSPDLTQLVQSTYLGGTGQEIGFSIAVSGGMVYVAGITFSTNFPDTTGGAQSVYGGGDNDGFVGLLSGDLKPLLTINIDIQPNQINPKSKGKIPVAILSTSDFNSPSQVDQKLLTFGRTGDEKSLAFCGGAEDVNGDGLLDLVCHFNTQETGFTCGDTLGTLKGKTNDGIHIEGSDSIRINPCK